MKTRQILRLVSIIFCLLLFSLINQSLSYADVETIGYWKLKAEQCRAVDVSGNIAYFGMLDTLVIADFSDPSDPVVLSKMSLSFITIYDIAISGIYVYAVSGPDGLYIIDASNPSTPIEVSHYETEHWAYGVDVSGDYVYIADGYSGLRVIDVSDPTSPEVVGFFDTEDRAQDVVVSGNYAYVADRYGGLRVIDVSDPELPAEVSSWFAYSQVLGLAVSGNYVYMADYWDGLRVIDVSDPELPAEVGFCIPELVSEFRMNLRAVAVSGNYAYVACSVKGLVVIDVTDLYLPEELGFYGISGTSWGVAVSENYAYVADQYQGLQVIDVSDPNLLSKAGSYGSGGLGLDVTVSGNYAYVADYRAHGTHIIDVSDPTASFKVNFCYTGHGSQGIDILGDYVYVTSFIEGLSIIDVSNPLLPSIESVYFPGYYAQTLSVADDYAYIATEGAGLRVIDVSNPGSPFEVGFYDTDGIVWGVDVSGDYAYLADDPDGLRIIDVSDPTSSPAEVGFCATGGLPFRLDVYGHYAYVADGSEGLRIIDVSDPASPFEVGFWNTESANDVLISGNYAYVATSLGLRIIDVSDPSQPIEVDFYERSGSLFISGDYLYVIDSSSGLYILKFINTPIGSDVEIAFNNGVTLDYATVSSEGITTIAELNDGPPPPSGFEIVPLDPPIYYDITTTATYTGPIGIQVNYDEAEIGEVNEADLRLFHYEDGSPVDITTSVDVDQNIIYGETMSLSLFGLTVFISEPPVEAIENVIAIIENLDLHNGTENSLLSKLNNAIKSLEKGKDNAAVNQLNAFINEVEAQGGKKIAEQDADNLVFYAQSIINAIQGGLEKGSEENIVKADVPEKFALFQNMPNPFNPETVINYAIPEQSQVTLEIYNILGEKVMTLIDEQMQA
ncbi:hypothetical protein JW824_01275, partial [bacterium]